jgi:hypothetical protein
MQEPISADAGNGMVLTIGAQSAAGQVPQPVDPAAASPAPAAPATGRAALARLVADRTRQVTFEDRFGRQIVIKKLQPWQRVSIGRLTGQDATALMNLYAAAALSVVMIDDDPAGCAPDSPVNLAALINRLEHQGIEDIHNRYQAEFEGRTGDKAKDQQELKNA